MSTVVYRDGVMASDTRAWAGSSTPIGRKMKIRRLEDGTLVGVVTAIPGMGEAISQWIEAGAAPDEIPAIAGKDHDFAALVVRPDGQAMFYYDSPYPSGPLVAPYLAIGSGSHYALGAMAAGLNAVQAVQIAIELDTVSCGPVAALPHFDAQAGETPAGEAP